MVSESSKRNKVTYVKRNLPSVTPFFLTSGTRVIGFTESLVIDLGSSRMERWDALADVITVSSSDITFTVNSEGETRENLN